MSASNGAFWFWSDWLGDQAVRRLTPAERGVWIDLLALAAAASPVGYVCDDRGRPLSLNEIARVTNAGSVDDVTKLINGILDKGAASRDRSGRLYNRRMVRDAERAAKKAALSAKRASAGHNGAQRTALKYFNKQILPRQLPQHLSGHLPRESLDIPKPNKNTSLTTSEVGERRQTSEKVVAVSPELIASLSRKRG